jgi:hypothetical protein
MYKMVFPIQIFVPHHILYIVRKVVLVLVRIDESPIQRHTKVDKIFKMCYCIGLLSPILILPFKNSRKCEGVQKFVLGKNVLYFCFW